MSNMVVRTNIPALNSHRNLGLVGNAQALAYARLSSGFRINSAADDAAGLAISEGMRAQIRGFNQAGRNAQDGISVIQTAEGYMQTITEMAQRMRELVVQRLNDTYNEDQRETINNEISQLNTEIGRIWGSATFNSQLLFGRVDEQGGGSGGSGGNGGGPGGGEGPGGPGGPGGGNGNGGGPGGVTPPTTGEINIDGNFLATMGIWAGNGFNLDAFELQFQMPMGWRFANTANTLEENIDAMVYEINAALDTATGYPDFAESADWIQNATGVAGLHTFQYAFAPGLLNESQRDGLTNAISNVINQAIATNMQSANPWFVRDEGSGRMLSAPFSGYSGYDLNANEPLFTRQVNLQVGPDSPQSITVDVREFVGNLQNLLDQGPALELAEIDALIREINPLRTAFGAYQGRLEFTIENQDIAAENLSASESRIRDADMAREMMRLAQADILQQTGVAILAQANQAPQSVLELLEA